MYLTNNLPFELGDEAHRSDSKARPPGPQLSLRYVLSKVSETQSHSFSRRRLVGISREIRDDLAVVLSLQRHFSSAPDIPPRLRGRSLLIARELDSVLNELCSIADDAAALDEHSDQIEFEHLVARLANVYQMLCEIDQEEGELLFEAFWQDIGVGD